MTTEVGISKKESSGLKAGNSISRPAEISTTPDMADYRSSVRELLDKEFQNIIIEEIHSAAQDLIRTQRLAIGIVKEDFKQIIREVLEEKKQSLVGNARKPENPNIT